MMLPEKPEVQCIPLAGPIVLASEEVVSIDRAGFKPLKQVMDTIYNFGEDPWVIGSPAGYGE